MSERAELIADDIMDRTNRTIASIKDKRLRGEVLNIIEQAMRTKVTASLPKYSSKKFLGYTPSALGKEHKEWLDIVNFHIWAILKAIDRGANHVREILRSIKCSASTATIWLDRLVKWDILEEERISFRRSRKFYLTDRGKRMLELFDQIGEIVKEIRDLTETKSKR